MSSMRKRLLRCSPTSVVAFALTSQYLYLLPRGGGVRGNNAAGITVGGADRLEPTGTCFGSRVGPCVPALRRPFIRHSEPSAPLPVDGRRCGVTVILVSNRVADPKHDEP